MRWTKTRVLPLPAPARTRTDGPVADGHGVTLGGIQSSRRLPGRGSAKDAAGPDEGWITEMYSNALAQASESERALAHKYLEDWLKNRRE